MPIKRGKRASRRSSRRSRSSRGGSRFASWQAVHYRLPGGGIREAACGRHKKTERGHRGATSIATTTLPSQVTCSMCQRHRDVKTWLASARAENEDWKKDFPNGARLYGYDWFATVIPSFSDGVTIRWDAKPGQARGPTTTLRKEQAARFTRLS